MIQNITVYCASSRMLDSVYTRDAEKLGIMLGERNLHVVNGGGCIGLMRVVSDAVLSAGGTVTGVIPRFMVDKGLCHSNLTTVIQTQSMHERKKIMADKSDAVIALPGGYGTLEELLEIITWRQLGLHRNPIIILNTNNFYDPLLSMFSHAVADKFVREEHAQLWQVAKTPEEVIELIEGKLPVSNDKLPVSNDKLTVSNTQSPASTPPKNVKKIKLALGIAGVILLGVILCFELFTLRQSQWVQDMFSKTEFQDATDYTQGLVPDVPDADATVSADTATSMTAEPPSPANGQPPSSANSQPSSSTNSKPPSSANGQPSSSTNSKPSSASNSQPPQSSAKAAPNRPVKQALPDSGAQKKASESSGKAAEEKKRIETQSRLASYNFVGNIKLGSQYMIVQQKSDNRWGIINHDGIAVESFSYSQVSARLKNDCYALKNDRGWVVFDSSLKKVATAIEKLDDYK